jgi:hypothetical protein
MATRRAGPVVREKPKARMSRAPASANANAIGCPPAAAWVSMAATAHGSVPASTSRRWEVRSSPCRL